MREKKKVLVRVSSSVEKNILTPLSHNIPKRARTITAKDDDTVIELAKKLNFDAKKLMKLNRARYPSLTMNARLMEGTVLLLDAEAREIDTQVLVEDPWTTGVFAPFVSQPKRDLSHAYSNLIESHNTSPYSLKMFDGHLSKSPKENILPFRGFCENEFSDIWQEFEPRIDVRTLDTIRKGNICTNTTFRFARHRKQNKKQQQLDSKETDVEALFRINRVNTSHFDSPSAFEEALTHKNEFIMMARRRHDSSSKSEFETLLSDIDKLDRHGIFERPVLETYPELAEIYKTTIREPMDLSTIRTRFQNETHYGIENIRSDLVLMCDNAMKFNPNPDSAVHRQASMMKREGLRLIDSFHVEGVDCGFVHYYIMYWKGSPTSQPVRIMYVATLQAVKPETHPDCEVKSESWTGTCLLTLAMEHARRLGIPYCILDATKESVPFYRQKFDFRDGIKEGKYYPMCLSLLDWCPEITLSKARSIPQRYVMRLEVEVNDSSSSLSSSSSSLSKEVSSIHLKFQQDKNGRIECKEDEKMRNSTKKSLCQGFETLTMMRQKDDSLWFEILKLQNELSVVESKNRICRNRVQDRIEIWRQELPYLSLSQAEMERIESWKQRVLSNNKIEQEDQVEEKKIVVAEEEKKEKKIEEEKEEEEDLYCVCRTTWNDQDPTAEPMYNCEHCDGWFHLGCLELRRCNEELMAGRCVVDKKGMHWDVEKLFLCNNCQKSTRRKLSKQVHKKTHNKRRKRKSSAVETAVMTTPRHHYNLSNSPRVTSSSGRSVRKVNYRAMLAGADVEEVTITTSPKVEDTSSLPQPKMTTPNGEMLEDTTSPPPQPQQVTTPSLSPRRATTNTNSVLQDKVNTPRSGDHNDDVKPQVSAFAMLAKGQRAFWKKGDNKKRSKRKKCSSLKLKKSGRIKWSFSSSNQHQITDVVEKQHVGSPSSLKRRRLI
jgi:hypothetical protein